ncbi:hypothetical protein OS493_022508 [Desmophyllum pertusum]|uniref:Uncharacterized protein n=1 Tax=Desmophyllum pertusum TaxID=174260 RepID=A0A9X0CWW1_9CNID|nr:hypothetical protein OS493_022508 [Desmophyllum pertusum]
MLFFSSDQLLVENASNLQTPYSAHIHVTTVPVDCACDSNCNDNEVCNICDGYTTYRTCQPFSRQSFSSRRVKIAWNYGPIGFRE